MKKIVKWVVVVFLVLTGIGGLTIIREDPQAAILALVISIVGLLAIFYLPKRKRSMRKSTTSSSKGKKVSRQRSRSESDSQPKVSASIPKAESKLYKDFPVKVGYLGYAYKLLVDDNDDYRLGKAGLRENCLDDCKVYKNTFRSFKPEIKQDEKGRLVLYYNGEYEDFVVGYIQKDSVDDFKSFVTTHTVVDYTLFIEGGDYKYYDSLEDIITHDKDELFGTLTVEYKDR